MSGSRRLSVGPGAMVAAAFIGPGTVTTASLAGSRFGVRLLWALAFSLLATLVLQEMAARLGLVTGEGLGEAIRARFRSGPGRVASVGLVVTAVVFGNAAYQTGNLLGGALGLEALVGGAPRAWVLLLGGGAFVLLWTGNYRVLERFLVVLVGLMSLVFLATAVLVRPGVSDLLSGLLVPRMPPGSEAVALGLVGTTVVPYNLFLHAAAVRERWAGAGEDALATARGDAALSIGLGGVVSMAIVVTAAAAGGAIAGATEMAIQLEPLLGRWAQIFFALGLLAAGLSSAITAPLAAAYAARGALGFEGGLRSRRFRAVWMSVLAAGVAFGAAGIRPVPAILLAQVANGLLLPGVAVFLVLAANDRRRLGDRANGRAANAAAVAVVAVCVLLGARAVWLAL